MAKKGEINITDGVIISKYDGSAGKINKVPGQDLHQETTIINRFPETDFTPHIPQEGRKIRQEDIHTTDLLPGSELTDPWARQIVDIAAASLNRLFVNGEINYAGASRIQFPGIPDIGGYKSGRNAFIFMKSGHALYILPDMFDFDGVQYSYK